MKTRTLESSVWVPRARDEVFPFFSDPRNLDAITPPWLKFHIITPMPLRMEKGARLDYRLKISGVPLRWQSEITVWDPPARFVDVMRRGPYRLWEHEHTFEEQEGGTLIRDFVRYAVPGGPLEGIIHRFQVGPDLEEIFEYRRLRLGRLLGRLETAA